MSTAEQLDPRLLEILACPQDKGPLLYFADEQLLFMAHFSQPLFAILGRGRARLS